MVVPVVHGAGDAARLSSSRRS